MSDQMIFKRYEIKYMLIREQKKRLCHLMKDEMIADGTITIEADSDGIDAEETLQIDGGSMTIAAGDDGVHSDRDLIITDGTIDVTKSYEGLEGMTVTIEDGDISVVSSDDGLNAAGDPADASSDNSDSNESNSDMLNPGEENTNPSTEDDGSDSTANVQTIATTNSTKRGDNNADKSDSSNNKTRPNMNGDTPPQKPDGSNNLKGESRIFPVHLKFTSFHYIFLLSECEHRIDAATGFFHNLLIQRNFFSAISEQTVIYIPQCGQLHIVTDTVLGQRIEFLIRALILQMLNNAVLRSDNKFLRIAFSGVIHDTGS